MGTPDREALRARILRAQRGFITRDQLRELGYSDKQIYRLYSSGRLVRVHPRTFRAEGVPISWEGDVQAALLSLGDGWVAGSRTAARLWELDGCLSAAIDLIGEGRAPAARHGVTLHETDSLPVGHRARVKGIPTTDIFRTLVELGRTCSQDTIEGALESAIRRGYTSEDYVGRKLEDFRGRGRRGCSSLAAVLDLRRGLKPTESNFETKLFQVLRRGGLQLPERQVPVYDSRRVFIARPDFLYAERRVAIEALSEKHHSGRLDRDSDRVRRNRLMAAGYRVIEVTYSEMVQSPQQVVDQIAEALGMRLF